jgi:hypothetical protein
MSRHLSGTAANVGDDVAGRQLADDVQQGAIERLAA